MALRQFHQQQAEFWDLFRFSWDGDGKGLPETLRKVTEHCASCFDASGASLFLNSRGGSIYRLAASTGSDQRVSTDATIVEGEGIGGACIELAKPMVIRDPAEHPLLAGRKLKRRADISSAMVIPLLASSGCIGVMNLSRAPGSPAFDHKDLDRAESVVRHIALTIENARLFSEVTNAAKEANRLQSRVLEILHSTAVAIVVVDHEERVTEANRAALNLLGHEAGNPDYKGLLACILECLHRSVGGEVVAQRFHVERSNRSWALNSAPLKSGGATVTVEEITQHETAERELARLKRLAEIGQMTAAIAHEIRNPLTSIAGASRLLRDHPSEAPELGSMIEEETGKLNRLCDEFLNFARPLELSRGELNLGDIAERLAKVHRSEFEKAGVELKLNIEKELPTMKGDPERIEQVMRNLLLNALQACEKRGHVVLSVNAHQFSVRDDGRGMDQETLNKLFTPFFTTRPQGTGLGLAIARKIIEGHDGAIAASSEPGKGTLMTVLFSGEGA